MCEAFYLASTMMPRASLAGMRRPFISANVTAHFGNRDRLARDVAKSDQPPRRAVGALPQASIPIRHAGHIGEELDDLVALELPSQHRLAMLGHAVHLEHGLHHVDANRCNIHGGWSCSVKWWLS